VIGRLALRSLAAHPVRTAVLAAGFGVGVAVMAILLGVAEIVLDQARAPALVGGGDVVIYPAPGVPARLVLDGTLQSESVRSQIRVAAPSHTAPLYLLHGGKTERVRVRAGIPSLERALGDMETAASPNWRDSPEDMTWTQQPPETMLRYVDRFHPIPDAPAWRASWAEWLYFNGRGPDSRFYLTFLVGPATSEGHRGAGVRLQLDRGGQVETFSEAATLSDADALNAPDLTIGTNSVRLEGMRYRITLDLRSARGQRARGELTIQASPGTLVPPFEITGARGWRTGYVVPVMSGTLDGMLDVNGAPISFAGGTGYHDHNWGFWQGVSWQWGQVQQNGLSLLYGRVFPPPEAADPTRLPGFLGVLGPDGPLGYTRGVTITEVNDARGQPHAISVRADGAGLNVDVQFQVESAVVTRASGSGSGLDFFQMRGTYTVKGHAGSRNLDFAAPGSAETFRGR
jgi:hypothetical protein